MKPGPFGGFKESGWGRMKAIHSPDACTRIKSVWVAREDGEGSGGCAVESARPVC